MDSKLIRELLWSQFGACIEMLSNCIKTVPDDYFSTHPRAYFITYHTIVFLDYYSCFPPAAFSTGLAFTQLPPEQCPPNSIGDMVPDKLYSNSEMLEYIDAIRTKCQLLINGLTEETLQLRFIEGNEPGDMNYSFLEIFLYNMRHTAHHIGQLHLLLRQDLNLHAAWVFQESNDYQGS
ncbi:DinB family protein [Flavihumibacter sp. CACIAM 22H1]|uniref:DinB family protein n=1 Tax=Flavihumibacter sp. CACIAM 22H1 TaxID=1812911 RepID=UPI0007A89F8F|nr:DinB family protein [Flavihumibacter sp. CACIAM 22H1]KYP15576.1 MAG: hypothetical protein A1D16_07995 [Flavihumibacter sp. CACIAM 22H1]